MPAQLITDNLNFNIDNVVGASENQDKGTPIERLVERAGRECYDSYGKGRGSVDFHKHIKEVNHTSVYGHTALVLDVPRTLATYDECCGRPGVYFTLLDDAPSMRVTATLRAIYEWYPEGDHAMPEFYSQVGYAFKKAAHKLAPNIIDDPGSVSAEYNLVKPEYIHECWVTLRIFGVSRGLSHELVRHGFQTGISQRSTRYCDESDSDWIWHPLMHKVQSVSEINEASLDMIRLGCSNAYMHSVDEIQKMLLSSGVDKATARKQARGAARGLLGNALETSLIFSASVPQWHRILRQRMSAAADAEIRLMAYDALVELRKSSFGHMFNDLKTVPSPDGIGVVLA